MPTLEQAQSWYPAGDPVHGLEHVLRVYRLAEELAQAEGADLQIVRAAALLHDLDGSKPAADQHNAARRLHHHTAAELARQVLEAEHWPADRIAAVQHCIRSHRFRDLHEPPHSREAQVLFDADKLDAIGLTGFARAVAFAVQAGQPIYARPSAQFLANGEKEAGEPHSAYHEYLFKLRRIQERLFTPSARRLAQERHQRMCAAFEQLAAEMEGQA